MADIKQMLEEEIENQIVELKSLEAGSEEKSRATEDLAKLYKAKIEETKVEADANNKKHELNDQVKDRYWRYGIEIGLGLIAIGFNAVVFSRGMKFEETGTYTSGTFRRFMGNFPKPFKK